MYGKVLKCCSFVSKKKLENVIKKSYSFRNYKTLKIHLDTLSPNSFVTLLKNGYTRYLLYLQKIVTPTIY